MTFTLLFTPSALQSVIAILHDVHIYFNIYLISSAQPAGKKPTTVPRLCADLHAKKLKS